jgi:hypothetical protein
MEKIEAPKIRVSIGQLDVKRGGIAATAVSVAEERVSAGSYPVPDVLAYLQNETELTRSTLVRIRRGPRSEHRIQRLLRPALLSSLQHEVPQHLRMKRGRIFSDILQQITKIKAVVVQGGIAGSALLPHPATERDQ